jgi:uncharacterized membrane protein YjjP (DUF1212 family)
MSNEQRALKIAVSIGALLMRNGAEVYRVEESIRRILQAYGYDRSEVFAIPNHLVVSIENDYGEAVTRTKRIYARSVNFQRVAALNDLSRRLSDHPMSFDEANKEIDRIQQRHGYSAPVTFVSYGMVGMFFTLMFGGTLPDGLVSCLAVFMGRLVCMQMERFHANSFFITLTASFIHTTVAYLSMFSFPSLHLNYIIVGTLMVLVPGVAFMTAVRDIISRDLNAGIMEMMEAIVVAAAIAVGSAASMALLPLLSEVV